MPGFYVAERAAGSGLAQSVTPFPTESDWAGTGKAGSPTPRTASGQGAAPHRVTQEYISALLFLTFQISPTGLFCQHHAGHGEAPFLPSCTIYSSTPKCHSAPIPWEPSWSQQNLLCCPPLLRTFKRKILKVQGGKEPSQGPTSTSATLPHSLEFKRVRETFGKPTILSLSS